MFPNLTIFPVHMLSIVNRKSSIISGSVIRGSCIHRINIDKIAVQAEDFMRGRQQLQDSVAEHRAKSGRNAGVAVITLSDSRSLDTDKSGELIQNLLEENGHKVLVRKLIPDNRNMLRATMRALQRDKKINAIITTGGTGLAPTDVTIEAVQGMLDKELPGFNSLFMLLSYSQVKSAAMLSRALAGTIKGKILFCLPGSPKACKLAVESLILPELGHILMLMES
jgi:molybdopterin adenylyltransferase